MNLLQQLKKAVDLYVVKAFPDGVPPRVENQLTELRKLPDEASLLAWPAIEHDEKRYCWRLGNQAYPHMKLVFRKHEDSYIFSVDSHDTHFALPAQLPGSEKLQALREANSAIKSRIESAWHHALIPVFGFVKPSKSNGNGRYKGFRVLAIDDESKILDLLGMILQNLGATFERAQSVSEARDKVKDGLHPDLILCDIMMPSESGYDFVAWYMSLNSKTPIYYVTGLGADHVNRDGVVDVVQKPFSVKDIANLLTAHYV